MTYKGNKIIYTCSTPEKRGVIYPLFRIDGPNGKDEGVRRFITSVRMAKEWINADIDFWTEKLAREKA